MFSLTAPSCILPYLEPCVLKPLYSVVVLSGPIVIVISCADIMYYIYLGYWPSPGIYSICTLFIVILVCAEIIIHEECDITTFVISQPTTEHPSISDIFVAFRFSSLDDNNDNPKKDGQ